MVLSIFHLHWGQYLGEGLSHGWLDVGGEDNVELYQESPLLERVSVVRHSFSLNLLHVPGFDDFSCKVKVCLSELSGVYGC